MPSNSAQWIWFVFFAGGSIGGWLLLALSISEILRRRK